MSSFNRKICILSATQELIDRLTETELKFLIENDFVLVYDFDSKSY